jgi:hypothetical protein
MPSTFCKHPLAFSFECDNGLYNTSKGKLICSASIQPGRPDKNAFHLVESTEYGRHFVTKDDRLLNTAAQISQLLQLRVLKPSEFLAAYYAAVERDPR